MMTLWELISKPVVGYFLLTQKKLLPAILCSFLERFSLAAPHKCRLTTCKYSYCSYCNLQVGITMVVLL